MSATRRGPFLFGVVAAAIFAAAIHLELSTLYGRLAHDLHYDDVVYALDAALRLDLLRASGIGATISSFATIPPHSPWMTLQAMAAFVAAGERDAALYASNASVLAAGSLAIALVVLRGRPVAVVALGIAALLSSPLAYAIVGDFRPDLLLGLLTALLAWTLLSPPAPGRRVCAGVLLGACLLVKPTFFAHTIAIALVSAAAGLMASRLRTTPPFGSAWPAKDLLVAAAIGAAIALPYFAFAGPSIASYFWANTFGQNRDVWNYAANVPLGEVVESSMPFAFKLARFDAAATLVAAVAFPILLARRGKREDAMRLALPVAIAAASVAIIVLGRQRSSFFFATFHWLLLFATLAGYAALDDLATGATRRRMRWGFAVTLAVLVTANGMLTFPAFPDYSLKDRSWNVRSVALIRADRLAHPVADPSQGVSVLVASAGAVNRASLRWVARRSAMPVAAPDLQLVSDPLAAQAIARTSEYVIAPKPQLVVDDAALPIRAVQGPLLAMLRKDPAFELLSPRDPEAPFEVYANRAKR